MSAPGIVVILWVLFYAYWMIAAVGVKKNIRRTGRTGWTIRLLLITAIFLLFRIPGLKQTTPALSKRLCGTNYRAGWISSLCVRVRLRNMGTPSPGTKLGPTNDTKARTRACDYRPISLRASSHLYRDSSRDAGLDACDALLDRCLHLSYRLFRLQRAH